MQVHFRYKPYPQSSFGEFVTNRAVSWRLWANMEDYERSEYVGADDDLLYRMRHNFGHTLGLGHTRSTKCIMYPTNVRGLGRHCAEELAAMKMLLNDKTLRKYRYRTPDAQPPVRQPPIRIPNRDDDPYTPNRDDDPYTPNRDDDPYYIPSDDDGGNGVGASGKDTYYGNDADDPYGIPGVSSRRRDSYYPSSRQFDPYSL